MRIYRVLRLGAVGSCFLGPGGRREGGGGVCMLRSGVGRGGCFGCVWRGVGIGSGFAGGLVGGFAGGNDWVLGIVSGR